MSLRLRAGALSAGIALFALPGAALGDERGAAAQAGGSAPMAAPASPAAAPVTLARGAIVVAVGEGATEAARPLASDVYRDEALRPAVDDATARALIGEPLAKDAPPKLVEIAEIRVSLAQSGSDAAARRLLASLGEGAGARIVVTVAMEGGRPVAKVLRVETRAFESVELGATVETPAAGRAEGPAAKVFRWPGAVATLLPLAAGTPSTAKGASAGPVRPEAGSAANQKNQNQNQNQNQKSAAPAPKPVEDRPAWKSPWFWATLGGVAAAGLAAFGIAKAVESDDGLVRLQGRVSQ